jgi:hypothetical protein
MLLINTNNLHIEANNPHCPANLMLEGGGWEPTAQNSDRQAGLLGVKAELAVWKGNDTMMT